MCKQLTCLVVLVLVFGIAGDTLGQPTGEILWEYWYDIGGTSVGILRNDPRFPNSPDMTELRDSIDSELDPLDNYGCRALGYLYAPVDGDYEFWVAGDDNCELWLSTDDDAGNATMIAEVPGWTSQYLWDKYPEQKSSAVTLQAGKKYYIEALMKEAGGGDTLTVGWGGPTIGAGPEIIAGQYLSPWLGWLNAYKPEPANGAIVLDTWVSLVWTPGYKAVSHDVYFSNSFDEVNDRAEGAFRGNQLSTDYIAGFPGFPYPDGLVPGTTYYWRIDEISEADPSSPWNGSVWSFSVPPRTAYDPDPADGAEFVDPNATFSWTPGFAAKLHTVYIGADFDDVNNAAGGAMLGFSSYSPGPLELEKVYYWRVDEFDPPATYKGDIWSFATPGAAGSLQPANGATDVQINATLNWTPATTAASHDVYFGTDKDSVRNATIASTEYKGDKALGTESYDPGKLAWRSDYYWRVDAVYNTGTVKGLVWSFTTADFILVDDFESYNDIDPPDAASNRIFDIWIDGFGTTTNGALVGNDLPPYAEQSIVHGGAQSMPYRFDNNNKTSEATLTLVYPRDWTEEGVTKLILWFRGESANAAERMFVALGNAVVYLDDASATQMTWWNEWVIDLTEFAGVDLTNVNTITIGFGTKNSPAAGGTGTMYFDDIRLLRPAPEPQP
ncbi:MAG: PA14 domain-containing protein [Planctomycetota bacterium]|nr:PA14 domain-containing protein [Planctomycetota bacterium]